MFYPEVWYWGNRLRFGLILTAAVMLSLAPLAWAAPLRELHDCATCPALIEVPAGTFERLDRLGSPTFWVHFERPYAIGKYTVTRAEFAAFVEATGHTARGYTLWRSFVSPAWLAGDCTQRLTRGGTWQSNWSELASYRKAITADERRNNTGFRVAQSLR